MKLFGGAFGGAAALLAGRQLGAMGEELPSEAPPDPNIINMNDLRPDGEPIKGTLWATHEFKEPVQVNAGDELKITYQVSEKLLILRLAHNVSTWCRNHGVPAGEWFSHYEGMRKYEQVIGSTMICDRIEFAGHKAMKWKELRHGMMPIVTSTDPESQEFQDIMRHANIGPHNGGDYAMYGPVYKLWGVPGSQSLDSLEPFREYELFCGNKSMRRFAVDEIGPEGVNQMSRLGIKTMKSRMGFEWYCPTLDIPGVN